MADGNINDMLSSVLGNEELMNKISSIVKETGGGDDALAKVVEVMSKNVGTEATQNKDEGNDTKEKTGVNAPTNEEKSERVSVLPHKSSKESVTLLKAIKPFLCKERCEMVDNILRFEQLASIIKLTR
ncbi:MAG: hypothetical protein IJW19_07015 [Clostridia bacterium]|nr:hypothetical protein [Clostridia bacterium]